MTILDSELDELSDRIGALSRRAVSAFFVACGRALLVEYERWAAHRGESHEDLLRLALAAAAGYAAGGTGILDGERLLAELVAATPPGDSPDAVSSTFAQDCWICADCAVRNAIDDAFDAGPCVEYALEPLIQTVSQHLFGCSQVGSSNEEEAQMHQLVSDARFSQAIDFCDWAIGRLTSNPEPSPAELDELTARASVLVP